MPQALSLSIRTNVAHRVVRVASGVLHTARSLEEQAQELLLQDGKAAPAAQSEASRDIPDAGDADDGDKQGCVQQACAQVARSTKMSRPDDAACGGEDHDTASDVLKTTTPPTSLGPNTEDLVPRPVKLTVESDDARSTVMAQAAQHSTAKRKTQAEPDTMVSEAAPRRGVSCRAQNSSQCPGIWAIRALISNAAARHCPARIRSALVRHACT